VAAPARAKLRAVRVLRHLVGPFALAARLPFQAVFIAWVRSAMRG
jgi:hypothetical protein